MVQGAKKIYVSQPNLFSKGNIIRLKTFDDSLLVNDSWAFHATGQIVEITAIEGDSLVLNKPLRRSYSGLNPPEIFLLSPRRQVHIKCISIERMDTTPGQTSSIYFSSAVDCSVKGIESFYCNYAHIDILNSMRITVENSSFKDAYSYGSGGKGYGVMLESTSGDCYIVQNNFDHLRHSMILQWGANGNVIAYNYSKDPYWSGTILPANSAGDIVLHGNYPYMNLFEGNVVQNIVIDNSHDINGPYNTFFRNRIELYGIVMNSFPASNNQNFIGNQVVNTSLGLGLYSLQGTGNYDYGNMIKGIIKPSGTSELSDTSLFGYSFNSFYSVYSKIPPIQNGNWQSQGPLIEAQFRFQASKKKSVCSDVVYQKLSNAISNQNVDKTFDVYPIPFTDKLIVKNTSSKAKPGFKIYSILGQVITEGKLDSELTSIETGNIKPGIYFLRIDGKRGAIKLLKE